MRLALPALLLLLAPLAAGALKYFPGNDSQPLIRRDLLPLDVDAIRDLAGHLATIADGPVPNSARLLRQRSQVLTLSQRLLPAQSLARAIEASLITGTARPKPDNADFRPAKKAVLESADWLTQLPPDSEGYLLGQLLLDILAPITPKADVLGRRDATNAPKRWLGVVPKVAQFETKETIIANVPTPSTPEPKTDAKYAVTALLTEVPMFSRGKVDNSPATPGLVTTSIVITEAPPREPTEDGTDETPGDLNFKPETTFNVRPLYLTLQRFFKETSNPLPSGYNLNINTNKRIYLEKNRENIAANIAMMLDAAVSGRSLRRNTVFFARLRADGELRKPVNAWEILVRLEELKLPPGTRIIVGSGMLEEMTGMLVLDKASFFIKYEILEAPTFADARPLFYDDGELPAELQSASEGYVEVRDAATKQINLGTFLSLASVEKRLVKASNYSSQHLSAKMLATQTLRRPAYFSRYMFAQELNRRLEPLANFEYKIDQTPERAIKDAYKNTRESIETLKRRLERPELQVLEEATDLIKDLNTIGRDASPILENEEEVRQRDMDAFKRKLEGFRIKLRQIPDPVLEKDE